MKLADQNRIVKIRAQVLAEALDAVSDLMNEIRQSEYYSDWRRVAAASYC